ncbi:MAG: hypothetical protein EZS28_055966, partial [Streblomastix strix]
MRVLLGRPLDSPEAVRLQEQHDFATKIYEMYYTKKAENLDSTGEQATKHERELLLQRDDEMLEHELNKKGVIPGSGGIDPEDRIETEKNGCSDPKGMRYRFNSLDSRRFLSYARVLSRLPPCYTVNRWRFLTAKRNNICFGAIQGSAGLTQQHFRCSCARIE